MDLMKKRHELLHRPQEATKEEVQIQESQAEFTELEESYNAVVADLEASASAGRFLGEFSQFWQALVKRQNLISTISYVLKDQQAVIINMNQDLSSVMKISRSDQEEMDRLKQETANALRMVDATHAREQVAQETIENLRQQIARLNAEMELKAKMEFDQDGEFASMAKSKEVYAKEREKLENELAVVNQKFEALQFEKDELEKKCNHATLKLNELGQDIENKTQEAMNELQLKAQFQEELATKTLEVEVKNAELISIRVQLKDLIKKYHDTEISLQNEKAEKQQLNQKYELLQQRHLKFQEEFTEQARSFVMIGQKINQIGSQMKKKEEQLLKNKEEFSRLLKLIDLSSKKFEKLELSKHKVEKERNRLSLAVKAHEKEIKTYKQNLVDEKRTIQNLKREKDQDVKQITFLDNKIIELNKKIVYLEQIRDNQLIDINMNEKTISKIKQMHRALEKDKERYVEEAKVLTTKVEALMEDLKLKTAEIFDLKKQILESETQFKQQQNLFDIIRTERNACTKELLEAQDEIMEFKQKMKVMTHQIEQLKEDISCKETQLTREELAHRKLQSEKEGLRVDLQRWKDHFKEAKKTIDSLREEVASVKSAIDVNEGKHHKMRQEMDRIMNERDILGSQLVRRNDEITLLYEKVRILQVTMDKGKSAYNQKIDDIRLLRLEVENLRTEKTKLAKFLNNTTDFRTEIYHLERDLTKERLKSRALEEELQTPLNIHRWRKLEGSDPGKLELIQKIQILQKRLLKGISNSQEQEKKLEEYSKKYEALKVELSRQPGPDLLLRLGETQTALKERTQKTKCLMGQVCAFKTEISDLNLSMQYMKNELMETKKLYFEKKIKAEKYKKELDLLKKVRIEDDRESFLPPIKIKSATSNNGANSGVGVITRQSF